MNRKILLILFILANSVSSFAGVSSSLEYVPNHGQWDERIAYKAEMKGGVMFVESTGVTYLFLNQQDLENNHPPRHEVAMPETIRAHALRVTYEGAVGSPQFSESNRVDAVYNYFLGSDPSRWASGIHANTDMVARNIYPGIDLRYYSSLGDVKVDWIIHAGMDPASIQIKYDGCLPVLEENGSILLALSTGRVMETKPVAFQLVGGIKKNVECRYRVDRNTVAFDFPEGYDSEFDLVIDPAVVFSSYTGSTADNWGFTATHDNAGNAISGGNVNGFGYPVTTGAFQMTYGGGGTGGTGWASDIAIAKFSSNGSSLLFATYLGGTDNDEPHSLVVDSNGNILVLGVSYSSNYPVTAGSFDPSYNGNGDLVISKLNPSGTTLIGSTFLGGSAPDGVNISVATATQSSLKFNYADNARSEIITDASDNVVVACVTQSLNFPVTAGVIQSAIGGFQDGVLFKLNSSLQTLLWSTYFGGNFDDACYAILQEPSGGFYITGGTASTNLPVTSGVYQSSLNAPPGIDGFILHIDSNATTIQQCTYLGIPGPDQTYFIQQDNAGNIYVLGQCFGSYPISLGVYSNPNSGQFIQKFNPQLSASLVSTTFGTGATVPDISPTAFYIDSAGNMYVSGWGRCLNGGSGVYAAGTTTGLPVTANAFQTVTDGCDFYFIVLSANATALLYGTFFGGNISEEHVDGGTSRFDENGILYQSVCAGCGANNDFPTQPGVVSTTNNSSNCNNAIIKFDFDPATLVTAVSSVAGSGNAGNKLSYTVYPNPANGSFSVEWNARPEESIRISLYDIAGRLVEEEISNTHHTVITGIAPGQYILKIEEMSDHTTLQSKLTITK